MTREEKINQLRSLVDNSESFLNETDDKDEDNYIWRKDVKALKWAIDELDGKKKGTGWTLSWGIVFGYGLAIALSINTIVYAINQVGVTGKMIPNLTILGIAAELGMVIAYKHLFKDIKLFCDKDK